MTVKITMIRILVGRGPDDILFDTDLPTAYNDPAIMEPFHLKGETSPRKAEAFVKKHFPGIPTTVTDCLTGKVRQVRS